LLIQAVLCIFAKIYLTFFVFSFIIYVILYLFKYKLNKKFLEGLKMKKIMAIILVLAMSLSIMTMTACTGNFGGLGEIVKDLNNVADALNNDSSNDSISFNKAKNYAEAYTQLTIIQTKVNGLLSEINNKHNENLDYTDENYTGFSYFGILYSGEMLITSTLSEETYESLKTWYNYLSDFTVDRTKANEYNISYKNDDGEITVYECKFDASTGSLSFVQKKNGEITGFYEFINLGNDKYALQNNSERAVVTYKDGTATNLSYSSTYSGDYEPYNHANAGIYPNGNGANENWVFADGVESYRSAYRYDGNTLKIDTNPEYGDAKHIEISAK